MNAIEIRNLSYTYPDGRTGIDNISLEVEMGSRVALVGGNGSGKSTLLLHLNGLLDGPGHIEIMGLKRTRANMKAIRARIGYLFSHIDYQFIMPDLINDIMISIPGVMSPADKREAALAWLRHFNLEQYEACSPLELSSGEMKRAALAGVLARDPDILLLDEPLNNIDRRASMDLLELLRAMQQTMVVATHQSLVVKKLATHIAVMEKGRLTGYYTVQEGLKKPAVMELLL